MNIIVRKDLKLPKGKLAVQAAHAAVSLTLKIKDSKEFKEWINQGQKKVLLYVENEKELLDLKNKLDDNFKTTLIRDAGRTVIPSGTITCIATFGKEEDLKEYTGHLKLV